MQVVLICEWIVRSAGRWVDGRVDGRVGCSVDGSMGRLFGRWIGCSVDGSMSRLFGRWVDGSVDGSMKDQWKGRRVGCFGRWVDRSIGWSDVLVDWWGDESVVWSIGQWVGRLFSRLVGCSADGSLDVLVDGSVNALVGQSSGQSLSHSFGQWVSGSVGQWVSRSVTLPGMFCILVKHVKTFFDLHACMSFCLCRL